jgi:glycosyltransferase involved in cell wall biosynthesis
MQYGLVGKRAKLLSVAEEYRKAVVSLGFPEKQTTTVVNGLDLGRVVPVEPAREPSFDFLTFGWDFHRKGGDLILDACRMLAREGHCFRLLFNGNGHTWPKLEEYLGGEDPEWLVRGEPVEDINALFSASRVFIQASRRETFSYAVCEAAYAGLPVISTDIAGLEWAHDLPTVDFVANEDAKGLCAAMKRYLNGKHFSSDQISYGRSVIEKKYSTAEWTRNIMEQYGV